ncbi:MAG: 1-acyl-sn-glycerol-3-phosphate acyltransferase [Clostridia bacterium]|nr:1-acyl-sn-glycerol-3-phosphate acyltransferase [Clostridia bacterium]
MKQFFINAERAFVRTVIRIYTKILYRFKVEGSENIPLEGPVIYCGNHRTFVDPQLIVVTAKRHVRFLAKDELGKNPLFNILGNMFDVIRVKRDSKDITALKEAIKTLKNGEAIALFPEGTRNGLEKGEKVKDGAAFFAVRTGAKVLPVGIKGGDKLFRKTVIKYGKPIDYSQYKGQDKDKEVLEKVTDDIMSNIIELTK